MPGYPSTERMSVPTQQDASEAHRDWLLRDGVRLLESALLMINLHFSHKGFTTKSFTVFKKASWFGAKLVVGFLWSILPMTHLKPASPTSFGSRGFRGPQRWGPVMGHTRAR